MADQDKLIDGAIGTSGSSFYAAQDSRIIGWIREAVQEGERINKDDPAYGRIDEAMSYIMGEQLSGPRPPYLPSVVVNQTKKAVRAHVSALTDVRPIFAYKTSNAAFQNHADQLNHLTILAWVNNFYDLDLADTLKYSATAGAGDMVVEWDPNLGPGGGDTRLIPRDPRDTLPIRPSRDRSIQSWEGVILREAHTPERLKAKFPDFAPLFQQSSSSVLGRVFTKFRRAIGIISPTSTLQGLKDVPHTGGGSKIVPEVIIYRTFIRDNAINTNLNPTLVGEPGTAWSYMVEPGDRLYPRGRLILATDNGVFFDGPNPYWHGKFPVARLKLDPWPWMFLGMGAVHDLMPMQDALNRMVNDFITNFQQHVGPTTVWDKNMPESVFKRYDPRRPNNKVKVPPVMGEGFKMIEPPQLPPWAYEFLQYLFQKFDEHSGTANLQSLLQLRQMPGADTIERYYEALTPELRLESRLVEVFLRDIAEMLKSNFFQFYSSARRIMALGDAGITLEDLDYDPNTMIPAMDAMDANYIPELDKKYDRDRRARFFTRMFSFYVAPNSILAMNAQETKLTYVQLARQGYLDFWSLLEKLEVPNVGNPPAIPLPVAGGQVQMDPTTGQPIPPPMEMRVPTTITERLMAQMQLGIGQSVSPVGRKATGQAPPNIKQRADGSSTIAESK